MFRVVARARDIDRGDYVYQILWVVVAVPALSKATM
jgi:hypothetical protein